MYTLIIYTMKSSSIFVLYFISISYLISTSSCVRFNNLMHNDSQQNSNNAIVKTVVVDQSGRGNFKTVQEAVSSIPSGNKEWIRIRIKSGIYTEKVEIPKDKQKIVMEGESASRTIIQFKDGGDSFKSSTFQLFAEYFIATNITFKNTYNLAMPGEETKANKVTWAPAALIQADKAVFRGCSFISVQDTLTDLMGRHYFEECNVQGAIDFIWGSGQSIYHKCVIKLTGDIGSSPGYITAQGRNSSQDTSGFVFSSCSIGGSGKAYLGRAYGKFSRVFFKSSEMSDVVVPEGWSSWNHKGQEGTIMYAEANNKGAGANQQGRVKWEKSPSSKGITVLQNPKTFIDQDSWMANLPIPFSPPNTV